MKKSVFIPIFISILSLLIISQINCSGEEENKQMTQQELIELGKYIVTTSGCDDCHTPKIFTEAGPVFDTTRRFSGFPQGEKLPALDIKFVTPDKATGIGALSEEMFIKTLREGKFMGVGRPLLPPMPWQVYGMKTDLDLKAIYSYLMSIKPINNEVPQPTPPDKMKEMLAGK